MIIGIEVDLEMTFRRGRDHAGHEPFQMDDPAVLPGGSFELLNGGGQEELRAPREASIEDLQGTGLGSLDHPDGIDVDPITGDPYCPKCF